MVSKGIYLCNFIGYSNILPFLIFVCYFTIYVDVVSLVWPILLNKFTGIYCILIKIYSYLYL